MAICGISVTDVTRAAAPEISRQRRCGSSPNREQEALTAQEVPVQTYVLLIALAFEVIGLGLASRAPMPAPSEISIDGIQQQVDMDAPPVVEAGEPS